MSHSKQTANYGLPLFEPKDRPAWLTDFNGAMTAVDATVKGLEESIQAGGLPVTGGTMQGSINMGDHAITNVQEVELQGSGDGLYIGSVVQPNGTAGARLTGVTGGAAAFVKPDSQSIYVPVSVGSPSQDKHAATKEYVDTAIASIPSSGITQEQADARYLQLSGGTMAGDLKVQESPASAASAVSKSYAQGLFASALPKSGGAMTGDLILNGAPTADNQAATKKYVDDNAGGKLTLIKSVSITSSGAAYNNTPVSIPNLNLSKPLYYNFTLSDGYTIGFSTSSFASTSIGIDNAASGGISYPAFKLYNKGTVTYNGFTSGMCILTPSLSTYDSQGNPTTIRYGFYCSDRDVFIDFDFSEVVTCGFGRSNYETASHTGTITFNFYQ